MCGAIPAGYGADTNRILDAEDRSALRSRLWWCMPAGRLQASTTAFLQPTGDDMSATLLERPARTDLDIRPMTGTCGVELLGVDLAAGIDASTVALVRRLLAERGVVFFRDQVLTPESHKAFAQLFGPIVTNPVYDHVPGHPEIMPVVKEPHDKYNIGDTWHSDMSYMDEPPLGSILYAREVPPFGGDTLWTNMTAAYAALPETLKTMLDGRRALHSDRFLTER